MAELLQEDADQFLAQTAPLWERLRGERIFVTGGTGFIGCWLLESFLWANDAFDLGASATVLTRNPEGFKRKAPRVASHAAIRCHTGDVREFAFPEGHFRYMIHAATDANPAVAANAPLETLDTIIDGTRRTLEMSRQAGVERYLLTSSGAVYGPQPAEVSHIAEDYRGCPDGTQPGASYGMGKRTAELLCTIYAAQYGISCMMARCFAFAGPYLPGDGHFAFGSFVRDALRGESIRVNGDGSPIRSYLYAMDLAVWLWTILFTGATGRTYNVGSEAEVSIGQLAREVGGLLSPQTSVEIAGTFNRRHAAARYVPSTQRAREELSLREYTDRNTSILRTAAWYRQTYPVRDV